jgi:hypothetical protein
MRIEADIKIENSWYPNRTSDELNLVTAGTAVPQSLPGVQGRLPLPPPTCKTRNAPTWFTLLLFPE